MISFIMAHFMRLRFEFEMQLIFYPGNLTAWLLIK
jgi:hypothetical protein